MGSGKGKARRVNAAAQSTATRASWSKFVKESRVARISVYQYYLGAAPPTPTKEDHERVTAELLSDAVDLGMVKLSPLYGIESFKFKEVETQTPPMSVRRKIEVSLKVRLRKGAAIALEGDSRMVSIPYKLAEGATMVDPELPILLNRLVTAVKYLTSEVKG